MPPPFLLQALLPTLVAGVLCFVPLFDLLGYESAAVVGAVLTVQVLLTRAWASPSAGPAGPLDRFFAALPGQLGLLLPPGLVLLANALRVQNCDLGLGLAFWGLLPGVGVLASLALGQALVAAIPRRGLRILVALLLLLASVGAFLWRMAWDPPIAGHTWIIGWFAGSIYDEALAVPRGLLWARLGVLGGALWLLLSMELAWRRRGRRPLAGAAALWTLLGLGLALLHLQRAELGIQQDQDSVKEALGGRLQSEHFVIWYDPASLDAEQRRLLVEDHEFRYAELQAWFDEDPVAWRGRRIESFVYPDRGAQQRLMGSRGTLVARHWTHQMHIRWEGYGDSALAHELAHLFTAPFGRGPLQMAGRWGGLAVDLGLVEGIARAADAPPDELSAHQASRAMRELGLAADLRRLFDPAGFWTQPGRRAYTLVGSFVQWLVETRGIASFKQVYGGRDFAAVYGQDLGSLVGEWEAFVDAVPLSEGERSLAQHRYQQPSIFGKVCARTMAELERLAQAAEAQGRLAQALALRQRILALQPRNVEHELDIARLQRRAGDRAAALAAVRALRARPELGPLLQVDLAELEGDLAWSTGDAEAAALLYRDCRVDGLDEARQRRLLAKQAGAGQEARLPREQARRFLVEEEVDRTQRLWAARRWADLAPEDPLAAYLLGRSLLQNEEYADALAALSGPPGLLSDPVLDEERQLLQAQAALHLGAPFLAEEVYTALLAQTHSSRVAALALEGRERARWKQGALWEAERGRPSN